MDEDKAEYEELETLRQVVYALVARIERLEAAVLPQDPDPEIGLP